MNANIGIEEQERLNGIVDPHGIDNRNEKGVWAIQFMVMQDLIVPNSYFRHNNYSTHVSYITPSLPQMLNIFAISKSSFKTINDRKFFKHGISATTQQL